MKYSKLFHQCIVLVVVAMLVAACSPSPEKATPVPEIQAATSPTAGVDDTPIRYTADLTSVEKWTNHPHLKVSDDELVFAPTDFEQVWCKDFDETLGDFTFSANFSYDTAGIDEYGVAVVIGEPAHGNFYFLGANPYQGNTIWFFVLVKNGEFIHPDAPPPQTSGQPDEFKVEIRRAGKQVSAYVEGKKIMTRDDIVFNGEPAKMRIGVHADGNMDTMFLHEMSIEAPRNNAVAVSGSTPVPATVANTVSPTDTPLPTSTAMPASKESFMVNGTRLQIDLVELGKPYKGMFVPADMTEDQTVLTIEVNALEGVSIDALSDMGAWVVDEKGTRSDLGAGLSHEQPKLQVVWLFAVAKTARTFSLHFPSGEVFDLSPLLPQ